VFYLRTDFSLWADVSNVFWSPIWFFRILGIPVLSPGVLAALQDVWKLSLVFSGLGLLTRISSSVAFLLAAYFFGLQSSFGKIHHADGLIVLVLGIFALSRCGDAWSLDRVIRVARRGAVPEPPSPGGEYTWPIRMIWLAMALVFFAAGVAKLRHGGWRWVTSDTLAFYIIKSNYGVGRPAQAPLTSWGLPLAEHPGICHALAAATILFELGLPLALFSARARRIFVPGLFALQAGVSMVMGPDFSRFVGVYLMWIPWDRVGARATAVLRRRPQNTLIFDGACGLCRRTVGVLDCLDVLDRIQFRDALADWPQIHIRFPDLNQQDCLAAMYAVTANGAVHVGFDAYRALAWSMPALWLAAPLLYAPGVPAVGRRAYAALAGRRHRAGCPVPARIPAD
jgi:predicted DCC family thiol-disulfide oxidoreductase YuxK